MREPPPARPPHLTVHDVGWRRKLHPWGERDVHLFWGKLPTPRQSRHPMAMKSVSPKTGAREAVLKPPSPFGRLDALLHSVRCIAQYEDALCELSHEVKQSGRLSRQTRGVLDALLKKLPAQDYVHDLDAVTDLLAEPLSPTGTQSKKTPAAPARKQAPAKPKTRRKSSS